MPLSIYLPKIQEEFQSQPRKNKLGWKQFVPFYFVTHNILEGLKHTYTHSKPHEYTWSPKLLQTAIDLKSFECAKYLIYKKCPGYLKLFTYVCEHNITEIATYYFSTYPNEIKYTHLRLFGLKHKHYKFFTNFIHCISQNMLPTSITDYMFYQDGNELDFSLLSFIQSKLRNIRINTTTFIYYLSKYSDQIILDGIHLFIPNLHPEQLQSFMFSRKEHIFHQVFLVDKLLPIDYHLLLLDSVQERKIEYTYIAAHNIPMKERILTPHLTIYCIYFDLIPYFKTLVDTYTFIPDIEGCAAALYKVDKNPFYFTRIVQAHFKTSRTKLITEINHILRTIVQSVPTFDLIDIDEPYMYELIQALGNHHYLKRLTEQIIKYQTLYLYTNPEFDPIIIDIKKYIIEKFLHK